MDKQPEALRLADEMEENIHKIHWNVQQASEELRRLHQVNQELVDVLEDMVLIFTPAAKDSTAANLIDKVTSLIAKHKEQE